MEYLDIFILVLFFGFTLLMGIYQGRRTNSRDELEDNTRKNFFLGGKNIPWIVLSISLVATETSTLTFLGIPALSYIGDYSFLSLAIGFIIGRIISALFILPLYANGNYFSIYQWIGNIYGKNSQKTLSLMFCLVRIFSDGVRLYAASLPLSFLLAAYFPSHWSFFEISMVSLLILSSATILYSAYGGFRAVVWTDFLQFLVYVLGGIFVLHLFIGEWGLPWDLTSLTHPSGINLTSDRFKIIHFQTKLANGDWDPYFFLFSIPGGILLSLGSHGTDQMIVQRVLACKNLKEGQYAMVLSGFLVFLQFSLFLLLGTYLYFGFPHSEVPNRVFSEYIVKELSGPMKGFILAGVFASSMSTLSSTLNSLALTTEVDWGINKKISPLLNHFSITVFWGILLFLASILPFFLDEKTKTNIVEMGLSFASLVFGSMISLFSLKFFSPKNNSQSLAIHFPKILVLSIFATWAIQWSIKPPFTWIVAIGIVSFYTIFFLFWAIMNKNKKYDTYL